MKIGRYEVVRELKTGGMATATLARAPDGRLVVLKIPVDRAPELVTRLRDEARVGARVIHPNLVETLDLFEHDGRPVLVVGFVRGVPLNELRRQGPVPASSVARIGAQIASCLHALHEATDENGQRFNVIHRDVSGGNIVVDLAGDAHLIDLGIATFDVGRSAKTETGQLLGTVRYMAPELLHGGEHGPPSDLWALAAVLVEAASGRPLYPGTTRDALQRIGSYLGPDDIDMRGVDDGLAQALRGVLRLRPEQRTEAPEFASQLLSLAQASQSAAPDLADLVARAHGSARSDDRTEPIRPTAKGHAVFGAPSEEPTARTPAAMLTPGAAAPAPTVLPRRVVWGAVAAALLGGTGVGFILNPPSSWEQEARPAGGAPKRVPVAPVLPLERAPDSVAVAGTATTTEKTTATRPAIASPLRVLDGCGEPAVVDPMHVNGDGTIQSEPGDGSKQVIELRFNCPVNGVEVFVHDAHGKGHRIEAYGDGATPLAVWKVKGAAPGAMASRQDVSVTAVGIRRLFLVPSTADHVFYSVFTRDASRAGAAKLMHRVAQCKNVCATEILAEYMELSRTGRSPSSALLNDAARCASACQSE